MIPLKTFVFSTLLLLPLKTIAYDFHNLDLGDNCNEALKLEKEVGSSHLSSEEFSYPDRVRHVYFVDYNSLDATVRYDCTDNLIIRQDFTIYFEEHEKAWLIFNNIAKSLSEKYDNLIFDCDKPTKFLGIEFKSLFIKKRCWKVWKESYSQIDLVLFKNQGFWRMMLRKRQLEPKYKESAIMDLSLVPGYDN